MKRSQKYLLQSQETAEVSYQLSRPDILIADTRLHMINVRLFIISFRTCFDLLIQCQLKMDIIWKFSLSRNRMPVEHFSWCSTRALNRRLKLQVEALAKDIHQLKLLTLSGFEENTKNYVIISCQNGKQFLW